MADERIEIEITLDDGTIKKGFATLKKSAEEVQDGVKKGFAIGQLTEFNSALELTSKAISIIKKGFSFLTSAINEAANQDAAVTKLNTALGLTGKYSAEASAAIVGLSDSLEAVTKFAGEDILNAAGQIQTLGNLSEESLKKSTKAAVDLASALGLDLGTAANIVGKAASGNVEILNRYGLRLKDTGDKAYDFAKALDAIQNKFGGAGAAAGGSFEGSIAKISHAFSNFKEEIGKFITQSPAVKKTLSIFADGLNTAVKSIKEFGNVDVFKGIIINFSLVAQAGVATAIQIGNAFKAVFDGIRTVIQGMLVTLTFGLSDTLNDQLKAFADSTTTAFINATTLAQNSGVTTFFDDLISKITITNGKLTEFGDNTETVNSTVTKAVDGITFSFGELRRVSLDVTQQIRQGFANAASQGIQAFVKAIMAGKNAMSAFGKAILGVFGDLAIQIGTTLIAAGLGMSALFELSGPKAIVAGAALIAIGSILKALSGGGAGSSAGAPSSAGGANVGGGSDTGGVLAPAVQERATNIKIDVQGTVLDPIAVGQQIATILNDTFDATGSRVLVT